jgi:methyl-accepting chemotaxis protein
MGTLINESPRSAHVDTGARLTGQEQLGVWGPGVRMLRRLHFTAKAVLVAVALVMPLLALMGWMAKSQVDQATQARRDATRQAVEAVSGVLKWAYEQELAGKLPREQAQQMALRTVATLRYSGEEYFWINDMQPRMLMHPTRPALDGTDISGTQDPNGLHLFKAMVDTVRQHGKGFVAYQWPKPGSEKPVDKVSYVQGFAPWGWVIGSGIYLDDLYGTIWRELSGSLVGLLVGITGGMLVGAYLLVCFHHALALGLGESRHHLRAMSQGDLTHALTPRGNDEAAELMRDMRDMQEGLRGMVARVSEASGAMVHAST